MLRRLLIPAILVFTCSFFLLFVTGPRSLAQNSVPEVLPEGSLNVYYIYLKPEKPGDLDSFHGVYNQLQRTLLELHTEQQVLAFEFLPEIGAIRLIATPEIIARLRSHPQIAKVEPQSWPVEQLAPAETERSIQAATVLSPTTLLTTTQTYTISGGVRDYDGTPVEGVLVWTDADDPVFTFDRTDASGSYILALPAGAYHLQVRKYYNKLDPPEQIVTVPPDRPNVDFTFPARFTIQGIVRDHEGMPVEDVWVSTHWQDPVSISGYTDSSGAYTLTVIAGTYHVSASKNGYPKPSDQMVRVPPDVTGVNFTFPQPYRVTGIVRDEAGIPIAGATVWGGLTSVTTAADGAYTTTGGAGEHYISARKDGYEPAPSVLVPAPPDPTGVDFILRRKDRTLRGQITDKLGQPLDKAVVWAVNILDNDLGRDSARTDAAGAYTLSVASGIYWVEASKEGYVSAPPEEVDLSVQSAQLNLALEPAIHTIRGVVRDSSGLPVADAWVSASACDLAYGARTDAVGAYTLTVGSGTYTVSAAKPGYADSDELLVAVPPDATDVDLILPPAYTISGRVTDGQGQPIEDVYVWTDFAASDYDSDWTDASGRYTLTVAAGVYTIMAEKKLYALPPAQTAAVPPNRTSVDFVLAPLPWDQHLQGRVLDQDGKPAATAYIDADLVEGQGQSEFKRVYYNGSYSVTLAAGVYEVEPFGFAYAGLDKREVALPPNRTGIDFTLRRRDQLITGRVLDSNGNPLCGIWVRTQNDAYDSDFTQRNGRYALQLPPGTYTVRASESGYPNPPNQTVTLPPTPLASILSSRHPTTRFKARCGMARASP